MDNNGDFYATQGVILLGDEPLEDVFKRLNRYGFEGIELMGEPELYDLSEIRQLCHKYEVKICSILSWCLANIPGRDPAHPDPEQRALANLYLKSCLDLVILGPT